MAGLAGTRFQQPTLNVAYWRSQEALVVLPYLRPGFRDEPRDMSALSPPGLFGELKFIFAQLHFELWSANRDLASMPNGETCRGCSKQHADLLG